MTLSLQSLPTPNPRSSDPELLAREIVERLTYRVGKDPKVAKPHDWLEAVVLVTRDRAIEHWMARTRETYLQGDKRVYYLSLEFLIGRLMRDAVSNLGLDVVMREALGLLDVDYDMIAELEADAALGNGGLGRLAACFMESMATVGVPAYGYGSATATASSASASRTDGRSSCPRPGSSMATPGNSTGARRPTRSASGGRSNTTRRTAPPPSSSGPRPRR